SLTSIILTQRTSRSTLFPYTTLFRSKHNIGSDKTEDHSHQNCRYHVVAEKTSCNYRGHRQQHLCRRKNLDVLRLPKSRQREAIRSEEHTSELQSPDHLVCRLLLEKKN